MGQEYNHAVIRELVNAALSDEALKNVCFDHFNEVYDKFTAGQTRGERILFLVEHVGRHGLEANLIKEIKTKNPHQYRKFKSRLGKKQSSDFQISDSPKFAPLVSLTVIAFISLLMTVILVGCFPIETKKLGFGHILAAILVASGICAFFILILSKIYVRWFVIVLLVIPLGLISTVTSAAYLLDRRVYEVIFEIAGKIGLPGKNETPEGNETGNKPLKTIPESNDQNESEIKPGAARPGTSPEEPSVKAEQIAEPEKNSRRKKKKYFLREEPTTLSEDDVRKMINEHNFFFNKYPETEKERWYNESGNFENDFKDNCDGTVTDHATGLMWQKLEYNVQEYKEVQLYVEMVNREKLSAGYDDWRLPSIEELASLLENGKNNTKLKEWPKINESIRQNREEVETAKKIYTGIYIDPVFDSFNTDPVSGSMIREFCWSADKHADGVWIIGFHSASINWIPENLIHPCNVRLVRSTPLDS